MTRQEFFIEHIQIIKSNKLCCEECGIPLIGDFSEVAHILEKSYFKSVEFNNNNIIYLCSWKKGNNCHYKLDNSSSEILSEMKVYNKVQKKVEELLPIVTEKINYKILDKWQI